MLSRWLFRRLGDLMTQVPGLMIAAELTQGCLVQLKQNLAELSVSGYPAAKPFP